MPRESSIAETAKQRSLRVPLNHYEQPDPLIRTKWWLAAVAALLAAAYAAWLAFGGHTSLHQVSPGPLSAKHATWNDDCRTCHQDFQPLRGDALSFASLAHGRVTNRESLDSSCIKCHNTPLHHQTAKPDEVPSCASCHREHRGRTADIIRASDTACLNCHRDLEQHRTGSTGLSPAVGNVTRFAAAGPGGDSPHPAFRSLASDPGNIKFNHWLHLQPGIAVADSKKKLQLRDLAESSRPMYAAYAKGDEPLQLDCTSCHQPDAAGGKTMQPIHYQEHCAACHPLEISFAEGKPAIEVPHGLTADRLITVLDGLLFAAERTEQSPQPAAADETGDLPLVPGKTLGKNLAQKISQDILGRRTTAARAISVKCQECHYAQRATEAKSDLISLLPSNIPAPWFTHARFDHSAHRHVQCKSCHEAAYSFEHRDKPQFINPPTGGTAAHDDEQVMIAGLDSCAKCHAPARSVSGVARHDCAECHAYHGGDTHGAGREQGTADKRQGTGVSSQGSSFSGSSLGTHYPEAPALLPRTAAPIRLAAFASPEPPFVGATSCTSAGCHGSTSPQAPHWQAAFTAWASGDPHAQAYDVLGTHRAREMTRVVSRLAQDQPEPKPLSDKQHFAALEQRCIGCHATPSADSNPAAADFTLGVHCESCHGPAGQWLHTHYRTGFDRQTTGFIDTKDISQRARACMKCHVGPNDTGASTQVVDHDLIAAGHPRLNFEFDSYFASLPAHWDRQADERRHQLVFHTDSWQAGQAEMAKQHELLSRNYQSDFAQLDCLACHQQLKPSPPPRTANRATFAPPAWQATPPLSPLSVLIDTRRGTPRYDQAVQAYLAIRALLADITVDAYPRSTTQIAAANSALGELAQYLSRDCFPAEIRERRPPTQYDSPSDFDPAALAPLLDKLLAPLRIMHPQ